MEEKTPGQLLKEKLFYDNKHASKTLSDEEISAADSYCENYKAFLNSAKTEREAVASVEKLAKENGFIKFVPGTDYKSGTKVYMNNRGKAIILAVIGKKSVS